MQRAVQLRRIRFRLLRHAKFVRRRRVVREPQIRAPPLARQVAADKQLTDMGTTATADELKAVLTVAPVNREGKDWMTLQSIIIVHDHNDFRVYASAGCDPKRAWNLYRFK